MSKQLKNGGGMGLLDALLSIAVLVLLFVYKEPNPQIVSSICSVHLISSILLLIGFFMNLPWLLLPWLWNTFFTLYIWLHLNLYLLIHIEGFEPQYLGPSIFSCIMFGLWSKGAYDVFELFKELRELNLKQKPVAVEMEAQA